MSELDRMFWNSLIALVVSVLLTVISAFFAFNHQFVYSILAFLSLFVSLYFVCINIPTDWEKGMSKQ